MTIQEMIRKYCIGPGERYGGTPNSLYVPTLKKLSKQEIDEIRAHKDEILAEFARRDREANEAAAKAAREREDLINKIKADTEPIIATWHDGEYLSGYKVIDPATEILADLGLGKYVEGWGFHVPTAAIEALGERFTYSQAVEYTRPAREAAAAKKAANEADRQAKFEAARRTSKPVLLRRWSEECNDPREECNLDICEEYALPDGETRITRRHTW